MEILPAGVGRPTLSKEGTHCLQIRVTGVDTAPADLQCRVRVDDEGRLRVAADAWLSLRDAARRAYEQTGGTELADMAERYDGTPEGVLEYYAVQMMERCKILAKKPPSDVLELYPKELWEEMSLCNHCQGIKYDERDRPTYVEPSIQESEFAQFMQWAKLHR